MLIYLLIAIVLFFAIRLYIKISREEAKEAAEIQKSLDDGLIYEPVTKTFITVEQAEKGEWEVNNDEYRYIDKLNLYFTESEIEIKLISEYLKAKNHEQIEIDDNQMEILAESMLLSKYSDWMIFDSFSLDENNLVLFPSVISSLDSFSGCQIMFWLKTSSINGHYYFRKKSSFEKITDFIRNDDEFKFKDFEVFTIKSSIYRAKILSILSEFENIDNIEIEIHNEDLYIKTVDKPKLDTFKDLFEKVEKFMYQ